MRPIGIMRTSLLTVPNSGKQCKVVHTLRFSRFSPRRKNGKSACWGAPSIPRQGPLALPCQTLHRWSGNAPFRALNMRDLTDWKEVCLQRPAGRVAAPLRVMKQATVGGSFPGLGFQYPTSVSQECIYSCPACHDCFRWNLDSHTETAPA